MGQLRFCRRRIYRVSRTNTRGNKGVINYPCQHHKAGTHVLRPLSRPFNTFVRSGAGRRARRTRHPAFVLNLFQKRCRACAVHFVGKGAEAGPLVAATPPTAAAAFMPGASNLVELVPRMAVCQARQCLAGPRPRLAFPPRPASCGCGCGAVLRAVLCCAGGADGLEGARGLCRGGESPTPGSGPGVRACARACACVHVCACVCVCVHARVCACSAGCVCALSLSTATYCCTCACCTHNNTVCGEVCSPPPPPGLGPAVSHGRLAETPC